MTKFIVCRTIHAVFVVAVVVLIVFAMMFLSGDPTLLLLPPDAN